MKSKRHRRPKPSPQPPQPSPQPAPPPSNPPNLIGSGGRMFADPFPGADATSFQVDNTSSAYYNSPYFLLHQKQVQPVPKPAVPQPSLQLGDIVGPDFVAAIQMANRIVFHAVGDTGAAKVSATQTAAEALSHEESVADAMAAAVAKGGPGAPSFFFHLGDVVYNFGEGQYYFDQFYEPFRAYDRPIFAVPGNHDGMVFGPNAAVPQIPTLQAFLRNFCASAPGASPESGGLVRSVMTQPGVYFTLDAPFVSIIGLYSNVLEGPGVISSEGGLYPIGDDQLTFLKAELTRLKPAHDAGQRAVLIAVHHPPASVDSVHGGTVGLSHDIDTACTAAGLWPDAVLSGHAHLYQRFSRAVPGLGRSIPYVVSGSGGFAATAPQKAAPPAGTTIGNFTLVTRPIVQFGFLTLTVDMTGPAGKLTISYSTTGTPVVGDSVTVNLPAPARSVRKTRAAKRGTRPPKRGAR